MFWRLRSLMLGIILGLLFSPGTGTENRRRFWLWLQGAAGQAAPKVQTQLQQVATKGSAVASQTLDQARQQVAPITQLAQEKLSTAGQTAQQKIGQVTSQATSRLGGSAPPSSPPQATGSNPPPTAATPSTPPAAGSPLTGASAPTAGASATGAEAGTKTAAAANHAGDRTDGQKGAAPATQPAGQENKAP
jgi:hypothetical protein